MASRPLEPQIKKNERKVLARRLRALLRSAPHTMREMCLALEIEPEVAVIILRELRSRKRGAVRSTIRLGHAAWWWEDLPKKEEKEPGKKKRKK
jgi:hypothetical protein